MSLSGIKGLDQYLVKYGALLGAKAVQSLDPLHVPGRDSIREFDYVPEGRKPFEPQRHLIAASEKMLGDRSAGFIIGECGVGKSEMAILAIHEHAMKSKWQGGQGGNYRAIVIAPDHLIGTPEKPGKWRDEIIDCIPDAKVFVFGKWSDFLALMDKNPRRGTAGGHAAEVANGARWPRPEGAEWYLVGRNQIKWEPDWIGVGEPQRMFDSKVHEGFSHRIIAVDKVTVTDEFGRTVYKPLKPGQSEWQKEAKQKIITEKRTCCPRCGSVPVDSKGMPISAATLAKKKHTCQARYLESVCGPDNHQGNGRDFLMEGDPDVSPSCFKRPLGAETSHGGRKWIVRACGEPLWQWVPKPRRWAPAKIIHKKLKRMFSYLVVDEVHEQKSDESTRAWRWARCWRPPRRCWP